MGNVTVQEKAFVFCRYSMVVLVWLAFGLVLAGMPAGALWSLGIVFVVMALSAIFTVRYAPLLWLWTNTLGRVVPSESVVLDVSGMRFSHTLASVLALVSISLVWRGSAFAPWFIATFGVLKTINAVYSCPAYKLWGALVTGGG